MTGKRNYIFSCVGILLALAFLVAGTPRLSSNRHREVQEQPTESQAQKAKVEKQEEAKTQWDERCSESKGLKAEIIAVLTGGMGTSITYHYYFYNIQLTQFDAGGRPFYKSFCGRGTVTGNSNCEHPPYHYTGIFNHHAYEDIVKPSFQLELEEDPDSGRIFYQFWTPMSEDYPIQTVISSPGGSSSGKKVVNYPRISIGDLGEGGIESVTVNVQDSVIYLHHIKDTRQYSVAKGEKCIQGHQVYKAESRYCPTYVDLQWYITLEEQEVEVEVEKCKPGWRPEKDKNPAAIMARIMKPEGMKSKFKFTLYDVSTEPGYCMNAGHEEEPDLEFVYDKDIFNAPYSDIAEDGQTVQIMESLDPMEYCGVQIMPHDYGAYGKLKAEVLICGMWYPAYEAGGSKKYIDIPLDDDGNHIADGCPQNNGKADDDLDPEPEGDGKPGDGFTNYEEYRGFITDDWEWHDTDINLKDFFAVFSAGLDFYSFPEASGLKCHRLRYLQTNSNRVVNFNHKTAHEIDQHGVRVVKSTLSEEDDACGYTDSDVWPAYPGSVLIVLIDPSKGDVEATVPHELGHCVGIVHHGEGYEYISKSTDPDLPWDKLCPGIEVNPEFMYYSAVWGGLHSGHENCFMRYNSATFYRRNDGKVYRYGKAEGEYLFCSKPEGTGVNGPPEKEKILRAGDYSWVQVLPKCGDATVGNCKGQIRVKDKE